MANRRRKRIPVEERIQPGKSKGGRHQPDGFVVKPDFRGPLANQVCDPIVIEDDSGTEPGWAVGHANGKTVTAK